MGLTGQTDHPQVRAIIDQSIRTIVEAGKVAGALANDANLDATLAKGVRGALDISLQRTASWPNGRAYPSPFEDELVSFCRSLGLRSLASTTAARLRCKSDNPPA